MATFVTTLKFTDQGEKKIQKTTKCAASFKATAKKMGVKIVGQYWTLGAFDGLLIYEAPDDETATALMLHLGSLDNVHTSTVRAFDASEMEKPFGEAAEIVTLARPQRSQSTVSRTGRSPIIAASASIDIFRRRARGSPCPRRCTARSNTARSAHGCAGPSVVFMVPGWSVATGRAFSGR